MSENVSLTYAELEALIIVGAISMIVMGVALLSPRIRNLVYRLRFRGQPSQSWVFIVTFMGIILLVIGSFLSIPFVMRILSR